MFYTKFPVLCACDGIKSQKFHLITSNSRGMAKSEAVWCIYASVQHANIASDNGLSPVQRQAIIWTNAAILSIIP